MPYGFEPHTLKDSEQERIERLCFIYTGRFYQPTASLAGVAAEDLPDGFCKGCRRYLSACTCEHEEEVNQ